VVGAKKVEEKPKIIQEFSDISRVISENSQATLENSEIVSKITWGIWEMTRVGRKNSPVIREIS